VSKYYIRYNTQHGESNLVWRVFENGKEHLVTNFIVKVPVYGESTIENNIQKWNVTCEGTMDIVDGVAIIK